jgi:hypothetical protein
MSSPTKARPVKRLQSQQRVSACVGDFEIDEKGEVTKKRKSLFGHVIKAVGDKQYGKAFDNGLVKECSSYILSVSNITASIPSDIPDPVLQNAREDIGMTHRIHADAWFGSVKTASEVAIQGLQCVLQIKQYHSLFPKEYIDDALKEAPGGIAVFLEGKAPNEVPLIAIGYRYSCKIILHFIATKNSGSTAEGFPYQMKYTDDYGNVHECQVERPDLISKF